MVPLFSRERYYACKRSLIYAISGIGNSISTLPLIDALDSINYLVDVVINKDRDSQDIFEKHPRVDKVFNVHDQTHVSLKYDNVFHCSFCHKIIDIKNLHKAKNHFIPPFFQKPEYVRFFFEKHEIEYFLDFARELGWQGTISQYLPTNPPPQYIPENAIAISCGYFKGDDYSWKKHWGNDNFVELARLLSVSGHTPVFIGAPNDWEKDVQYIASKLTNLLLPNQPLFFFSQNLLTSFGIMQKCRGNVGNETSMIPASAALGKPTLSLIMREAEPSSICPIKNYPYPDGLAAIGLRENLDPEWVCNKILSLISCKGKEKVVYL